MVQTLDTLSETPSQTAGPFVHIGMMPRHAGNAGAFAQEIGTDPFQSGAQGDIIEITGAIHDGTGWAIRDALLESWHCDAAGIFPGQAGADPHVSGFCRFATDAETGDFTLCTIKPGAYRGRGGVESAPHISLWIVARGINTGLHTRLYFSDEDNAGDPLLARIEQRPRIDTLIAQKIAPRQYRFDIRLQGPGETVFLDM